MIKLSKTSDEEAFYEAIRVRGKKDFQFFCQFFFSHYLGFGWNLFHKDVFKYYSTKSEPARTVDCAPRGYAKSTLKTLFKPTHDLCYGLQKYILFVSDTKAQSGEKLKDIRGEIIDNPFLSRVYGLRFNSARPNAESFEVHTSLGTSFLRSVSSGTEIRGLRYREHRPSKIILDDVENSEEVLNEELREKTKAWFFQVISKLGSEQTDIEIVGTVLHRDSLLMQLTRNPRYQTKIYKAVISWAERKDLWLEWRKIYLNLDNDNHRADADVFYKKNEKEMLKGTKVLWPERESYYFLMKEMEEIGRRAFMKEKQNQPLPSNQALFDDIWWYTEETKDGVEGFLIEKTGAFIPKKDCEAYAAMDPATGESSTKNKKSLDYACIAGGYKDLKGRLFVHMDYTKKAKPTQYIKQIFEMHWMMDFVKFALETNLYRGLLLENIIREKKKIEAQRRKDKVKNWGVKVPFYEVENRENKVKRIFTLEPKVNNGYILFNKALSHDFMEQLQYFPSKEVHDDAPDTLEMLWGLVNNRYQASAVNLEAVGSV